MEPWPEPADDSHAAAPDVGPAAVEDFVAEFELDERCSTSLQELSEGDQAVVIDTVRGKQCDNPSAFTWSIIKKMKMDPSALKTEYLKRHLDERCLEGFLKLHPAARQQVALSVDVGRVRNLSAFVWRGVRAQQNNAGTTTAHATGNAAHGGDFHGGSAFGWTGGGGAGSMPASGGCGGCSFASARDRSRSPAGISPLLQQIAQLRSEIQAQMRGGTNMSMGCGTGGEVSDFARMAGLDDRAAQSLLSLDPEGQTIAMALVQKKSGSARNPSAVAWSIVKTVRDSPIEAKKEYLRTSLDSEASAALERLSPEQQEELLAQVDIGKCRNLSALIWSRIKHIAGGSAAGGREQFYGNGRPVFGGHGAASAAPALDDRCWAQLGQLPEASQQAILDSIPVDCRNPSAFVWSKVKLMV